MSGESLVRQPLPYERLQSGFVREGDMSPTEAMNISRKQMQYGHAHGAGISDDTRDAWCAHRPDGQTQTPETRGAPSGLYRAGNTLQSQGTHGTRRTLGTQGTSAGGYGSVSQGGNGNEGSQVGGVNHNHNPHHAMNQFHQLRSSAGSGSTQARQQRQLQQLQHAQGSPLALNVIPADNSSVDLDTDVDYDAAAVNYINRNVQYVDDRGNITYQEQDLDYSSEGTLSPTSNNKAQAQAQNNMNMRSRDRGYQTSSSDLSPTQLVLESGRRTPLQRHRSPMQAAVAVPAQAQGPSFQGSHSQFDSQRGMQAQAQAGQMQAGRGGANASA